MVRCDKLIVYLIGLVCCFLSALCSAQLHVALLGASPTESAEMVKYLQNSLKDEVDLGIGDTAVANADVLLVFNEETFRKLPDKHLPTLVLAPTPSTLALDKQDGVLYWTPSLAAQLALIRYLLPATNRIGMLVSSKDDESWVRVFKQYAGDQSIEVRFVDADPNRLARQVAELAANTDVLLAQPDLQIYNRENIRIILLSAYRQNRVLIGPSPAFVSAGALATLYASSDMIAEAVAQRLRYFSKNNKWPQATRLKTFTVSTNMQVAKAMGLTIPSTTELERMIRFEELPTWP